MARFALLVIGTLGFHCSAFTNIRANVALVRRVEIKKNSLELFMSQDASTVDCVSPDVVDLRDSIFVVKYGGDAMKLPKLAQTFYEDVAELQMLGAKMIIVHGGGPQISAMLSIVDVESKYSQSGIRVNTPEVVNIAEMVLCGSLNKLIANNVCNAGGKAIGLSGRDNKILQCVQKGSRDELGFAGAIDSVNVEFLKKLLDLEIIPVISPIGCGKSENEEQEVVYSVNPDVAAGRMAGAVGAKQLIFLTDAEGIMKNKQESYEELSLREVNALIRDQAITGDEVARVKFAVEAVQQGVESANIIDGRHEHALLDLILNDGENGGTTIRY